MQRKIGGRITPAIIAYASYLVDAKAPEGPYFEVAIIHHTDCGSTLLADDDPRHGFAQRIGTDERALADTPVLDPARTVQIDVNRGYRRRKSRTTSTPPGTSTTLAPAWSPPSSTREPGSNGPRKPNRS